MPDQSVYFAASLFRVMRKSSLLKGIVSLVLAALVIEPWLTSSSAHQARTVYPPALSRFAPLYQSYLLDDFDGDNSPDEAELSSKGQYKSIRVSLSRASVTSLSFDSKRSDRGRLVSGDIDRDNDQDLVWFSQTMPQEVVFWLNDGKGNFGPATSYQPSEPPTGLNLNPLLHEDSDTSLSSQEPLPETVDALRTADSPAINLTGRHVLPAVSTILTTRHRARTVQSFCLKSIRKRGPPTIFSC